MKKFLTSLFVIAAIFCSPMTYAQTLDEYTFSSGEDSTRWITLPASTSLITANAGDAGKSTVQNLGFTFPFAGTNYTQFSVNADGNLKLGGTVTGTTAYSTPFSSSYAAQNNPKINMMGCDGFFAANNWVYYKDTVDAQGNAVGVVEFCESPWNTTYRSNTYKWQVQLYHDGTIQIVFGHSSATLPIAHQMGLCVDATDGWTIDATNNATHFTNGTSTSIAASPGYYPAHGRYYRFGLPNYDCPKPTALTSSNLTSSSFDIAWTDTSSATSWIVILENNDTEIVSAVASSTSFSFSNLNPNTAYTVKVAGLCANGDTSAFRTQDIRTACGAMTQLPFICDFEDAATGSNTSAEFITCWTRLNNGTSYFGYPYVGSSSTYNHTTGGTKGLYWMNAATTGTYGDYQCMALPLVDVSLYPINTLQLKFWARSSAATTQPVFEVGVMSDPNDLSTFQAVRTVTITSGTTWSEYEVPLSAYTGLGAFVAIKATRPASTLTAYIDDIVLETIPNCPNTSEISVLSVGVNEATLHWTEFGSASQWTVEYDSVDFVPGANHGNLTTAFDTTFTLTGLERGTTYYVYIHADCGGDTSQNRMVSFTTLLSAPAELPFTCDFEDDCADDWSLVNGTCTNQWVIDSAAHNGANSARALYISSDNGATHTYDITSASAVFAFRTIEIAEDGQYDFGFDWTGYGEGSTDFIRAALVPTGADLVAGTTAPAGLSATALPAGCIAIDGGSKLNLSNTWQRQLASINVPAGTYKLTFYWRNDGSAGTMPAGAIDNIIVRASACPGLDSVIADNATENSVDLTCYASSEPDEYMIIYTVRGSGIYDTVSSSSNTISLTDLPASSYFDAMGYTICGDDTTFAILNFNFRTNCGVISDFPWDYGFEGATWYHYTSGATAMYWPYCWAAQNYGSSTSYNWRNTSTASYVRNGSAAAYFYSTTTAATQAALNEWLFTPQVDLTGNEELTFWLRSSSTTATANYHCRVKVMVSNDTTSDKFDTASYTAMPITGIDGAATTGFYTDLTGTTYQQYSVSLAGQSGIRWIAFVVDTNSYTFYMDDLRIYTVSNCPDPVNPHTVAITDNEATIEWGDVATDPTTTSWDVYYGMSGFDADTATSITVTDTTITLTDLLPQTSYEFYVVAHCSDGSVANATPRVEFSTECSAFPTDSLPYVEDFESYGSGAAYAISPCWHKGTNYTTAYPYPSSTTPANGSRSLYFYSSGTYYSYAVLPRFEADLNTMRLRFSMKNYSTISTSYGTALYLGVMTDPNDITTFDTIQYLNFGDEGANNIHNVEYFFDTYTGEGEYMAVMAPITTGLGFTSNYVKVDDVIVDLIPNCRRSTLLSANNVTATSATLTWHNNSDNVASYDVAYSTNPDFDPSTCPTTVNVLDTTATINGLTPFSYYYFKVKANCDENNEWSDRGTFHTSFDCGNDANTINVLDTIGDGTSSGTYVAYTSTSYPAGHTAHIFTAQELNDMGIYSNNVINSIALHASSTAGTIHNLTIYMKETDFEGFTTTTPANDSADLFAGMTQVFHGDITTTANQWIDIMLDSAFNFSGSHNLLIRFYRDTLPSSAASFFYTSTSPNYLNVYGYRTTTATSVNIYRTYSRPNIAFNICTTIPSCDRPDNVTLAQLTPTSAQMNWNGSAANYEVAYGPAGFSLDSADGIHTIVNSTTYTCSQLTPSTDYQFYVRSLCSNPTDTSNWSLVYNFHTPCAAQALPYTEDFESYTTGTAGSISSCWTKGTSYSTAYPYVNNASAYQIEGSKYLYFYANRTSTAANYSYAALPMFNAALDSLTLTFSMRRYGTISDIYSTRLLVGVMTDPADISTFEAVDTIDMRNDAAYALRNIEVDFANYQGQGQFIALYCASPALYGTATSATCYAYVDDIRVDYTPTCKMPTNIVVADSTITGNTAVISWTDRNQVLNGYELEYGPAGFEQGTGTIVTSTTNPTTLTGLNASTNYDVYIRSHCSSTDESPWSFAAHFATECEPMQNLPVTFDLEGESTGSSSELPLCWTRINDATGATATYTGYPYINNSATNAHSGSNYLYFYTSSTAGSYAENEFAVFPEVDTNIYPTNNLEVVFWGRGYSSSSTSYDNTIIVGMMSNPNNANTFVAVDTVTLTSAYAEYSVQFSNYQGNGSYIAFRKVRNSITGYAYIDDITIEPIPTCPKAIDLTVEDATTTSITIDWTDVAANTAEWEIEYGVYGYTHGTGATTIVNSHPATISGLQPANSYQFFVRPICNAGDTGYWSQPLRANSSCVPFTAVDTLREDFHNVAAVAYNAVGGNLPPCWEGWTNGTDEKYLPHVTDGGTYSYSLGDSAAITMTSGSSDTYGDTKIVRLPILNEPVNSTAISFWMCTESNSYGTLSVGYMTGNNYATDFVSIKDIAASAASQHEDNGPQAAGKGIFDTVSFENAPDNALYIAFRWVHNSTFYSCCLDNIEVTSNFTCAKPVVTSNVVDHESANITWVGSGDSYEFQIAENGSEWPTAIVVNGNNHIANGLYPSTTYDFRIRQICDEESYSLWTEGTFTTDSLPCFSVTDVQVLETSVDGATITWTDNANSSATSWVVNIFNSSMNRMDTVSTKPVVITNLYDNTDYSVSIQSMCSSLVFSDWSDTIAFHTATCEPVENVAVSGITFNSAVVTWNGTADEYEINWGLEGFPQGSGSSITTTENRYEISNLEELTSYDVYVRTICASGIVSVWSTKINFSTLEQNEGIDGVEGSFNLSIYPNPTTGNANISLSGIEGNVTITVVDINGREVERFNATAPSTVLRAQHLAQGTYFVRVLGDGINSVRKLIVR